MEQTEFKSHISQRYNASLEDLFNQVLEMGGLVEKQLENAVEAIKCEDKSLAKKIKQLDRIVNKEEVEIDRLCASVFARQQPTASDLRLVVSAIRIAVDLERIGDEAVNASKLAIKMSKTDEVPCNTLPAYDYLMQILDFDRAMLQKVLTSFAELDINGLSDIIEYEDQVSAIKAKALVEIQQSLNNNSDALAEYIMQMIVSIRSAERVSAHIVNVCESIIYLVEGEHVRNVNSEKLNDFLNKAEEDKS
ncbi:phosphate signaling complex protein PhoU [Thiomicrorhabdus sp. Milos-T2]|uniref:phosphate signaling complex protein PhoU n=1 Tax=Thiomicrorhabdus sp. Milos-T2 TaxID=90814 RepID=UPI000493BB49|nr:phosphate signaling complex protein PhoU [Thiomicrorhabdus sp. Milos-T2]